MENIGDGAREWIGGLRLGALDCYEWVLDAGSGTVRAGGDSAWVAVTDVGFVIWVVCDTVERAKEGDLIW